MQLNLGLFLPLLFLGDGANDVSMIQVADVGVGISGQEGMQVKTHRAVFCDQVVLVGLIWSYFKLYQICCGLSDKTKEYAFDMTNVHLLLSQQ
jgi:P-type E1-E2 ATPase